MQSLTRSSLHHRAPSDIFFLKHKSSIFRQSSTCMLFIAEPSPFSVCQITQSLTCSIMEKPHTGLDDCPRMLLPCFKNKMSVHFAQRFLPRIACRPRIDRNLSVFSESSSAQRFAFYNRFFPHSDPLSLSQISFHFPFPKQSLQSGVVSHKNCLIAVTALCGRKERKCRYNS